jgi:LmbE family N-acetylglucosaminyl deacetylase
VKLPESILILAPHPDDEALMTAGVIRQAVAQGVKLTVCVASNGAYLDIDGTRAAVRRAESLSALSLLGIAERDARFLGYPDTGMEPELSFFYNLYGNGAYETYRKADFERELDALLEETKPKLVITSSPWDMHGDHVGLYHFAMDAVSRLPQENRPEVWQSLVHSPAGDDVWPIPGSELFTMPPGLEETTDLKWSERVSVPLPIAETERKLRAIQEYRSALKYEEEPEVVRYLLAFAKREEIFWSVNRSDEENETI